jgi:hypothetical protein
MNKLPTIIAYFSILLFLSSSLIAQKDSTLWYSWGMSFGIINPKIKFETTEWVKNGLSDTLKSVSNYTQNNYGISAGVQVNLHINHSWVLRLSPEMVIHDMGFIFIRQDSKQRIFGTEVVNFEIPFHFVYTVPQKKYSPTIFFGGRYCINRNVRPQVVTKTRFDKSPNSEGLDGGIGCNIRIASFTIRPEIMYFFSTKNILQSENIYTPFKTFSKISRNYMSVKLLFFGSKW